MGDKVNRPTQVLEGRRRDEGAGSGLHHECFTQLALDALARRLVWFDLPAGELPHASKGSAWTAAGNEHRVVPLYNRSTDYLHVHRSSFSSFSFSFSSSYIAHLSCRD
jgi:hypothetical protein